MKLAYKKKKNHICANQRRSVTKKFGGAEAKFSEKERRFLKNLMC